MYQVSNVSFAIGKKTILKDISFSINEGEVFTIIGPNGSGKTTLFRLLTGVYKASSGDICIDGIDIRTMTPKSLSKKIAVISQNTNIQFPFTCFEVVMMGRNPHIANNRKPSQKDMNAVISAMEQTNTLKYGNRLITTLSGGEKQRIMLARSLAQDTPYIFLDEAFSEMDMHYVLKSMKLLRELVKRRGITVVNIVHDLNVAYHFSDRVLMLKDGRIDSIGHKFEVMKNDNIERLFNIRVENIQGKGMLVLP
ncbi:MAG: ABC transporter ATP-binding protein [Thermacetogeniaceae bacterium]|jgi:iron complex transport system ATP-binding protein